MKRDPAEVKRIVGPIGQREPSRDLNIVWVWGIDKLHEKETHEYAWVMDRYVNVLLPQVPRVTVVPSMYFPKKELWEKADLVVFYLWPRERWDYDLVDAYQKRGGGLIFIHMALMQGSGEELSKRIGMAWDLKKRRHQVGRVAHAGDADRRGHGISHLRGLSGEVRSGRRVLLGVEGRPGRYHSAGDFARRPGHRQQTIRRSSQDRRSGRQAVAGHVDNGGRPGQSLRLGAGHNYFTFNDPYFRIILLRAMAWTMNESFDPFKPLVTLHLER